jgi:hypothetical protein
MARWNEPTKKEAFFSTSESIGKAISTPSMPYSAPEAAPAATGLGAGLAKKLLGGAGKAGAGLAGVGKGLAKKLWEADLGVPTAESVGRQVAGM